MAKKQTFSFKYTHLFLYKFQYKYVVSNRGITKMKGKK